MKTTLTSAPAAQVAADALAIPVPKGGPLGAAALEVDRLLGGLLTEVLDSGEHRGRFGQTLTLRASGGIGPRRVLLYGVGDARVLDGQRLRYAHHQLGRAARELGYRRLAVLCSDPVGADRLGAAVEGIVMGDWDRGARRTEERTGSLDELVLAGFGVGRDDELALARQLGEATNRARGWVDAPANELGPEGLAAIARGVADRQGLEVQVLGPDELRAGGYHLLLGVAAGSAQEPRLIRVQHRGADGDGAPNLALVGKGITFDSGGLSLKSSDQMRTMRGDMGGAAAVLAAIEVIAAGRFPLNVQAVVAATENMTGAGAQRPGDVWTSANGKTVEVLNTDAEGRLVLADAITFALRQGATHVVDLATLTGAAVVAIGHAATAAVANDDALWAQVVAAADRAGDRAFRLPTYPEYRGLLKSRVADLRNAYYGEAGTICAGMFLQEFVEEHPWVHLDIAGSAWNENGDLTEVPRGPLGSGTRLIVRLAELMAAAPR